MSKLLGKELTDDLLSCLNGHDVVAKTGRVIIIVTVDENGWPHPAMLSYYEMIGKDKSKIDLAIGKGSTTRVNLRRTGQITILITDKNMNYYIKGRAREIRDGMVDIPFMSLFRVDIDQLLEDQEPNAPIICGVTFIYPKKQEFRSMAEKLFKAIQNEPLD